MNYQEFLKSKIELAKDTGIQVNPDDLCKYLKPHQRDSVIWALKGGKRAIFSSFGLGKTLTQIEILRQLLLHEGGKALIVCPLGVKQEFTRDAKKFVNMEIKYIKHLSEATEDNAIYITNYERVRDGDIDPKEFTATTLDEAAVLRSFGSKTFQTFLDKFKGVKYKYVATATPSPNKYKELIHYAGYLEIMDTGQALTRFFQRDSTQANKLTLYPHKEAEFWLWMSSWALYITKPSDLGYSDEGYDLPPLQVHYHELPVNHLDNNFDKYGEKALFRDAAISLADASREKRDSINDRVNKAMEIIGDSPDDSFIIWHDLEAERHAIKKVLPESKDVYGSQDIELREKRIIDFSEGEYKYLSTKPVIAGSGCNFQHYCNKAIFLGIGYKFADFIQAVHRIYRFMQGEQVEIHIIYMESEDEILRTLQKKWSQHNYLVEKMTKIIQEEGLSNTNMEAKLMRSIGCKREELKGKLYTAVYNDCIQEAETMESNSIDLIHTSIPFSNHYEYSPSYNDLGHNTDNEKFFEQMDFLTPELYRILKPGRVAAIHVKDRVLFGNATGTGMPTIDPFSDMTTAHYMKHGFQYFGRITIITDVVRENNQTYRLGWTENSKDGTKMGVGCPEYILLFRKLPTDTSKAYADTKVAKSKEDYTRANWQIDAHAFWRSSGDRPITTEELMNSTIERLQAVYTKYSRATIYNHKDHVMIADNLDKQNKLPSTFMVVAPGSWHPEVWDDINRMNTMNGKQAKKNLAYHICPLQFDIVERVINRYSNKGDLVLDPFAGLFTVPYQAVKMGRKGYGIELNRDYWIDGCGYMRLIEEQIETPTLFDIVEPEMLK